MQIQQPSQFHSGHVGKRPPPVVEWRVMEGNWGGCPAFALRLLIGWLPALRLAGFPALRLASFQGSDWPAFSAPTGHNYTLVYAVVMYSSLYSVY